MSEELLEHLNNEVSSKLKEDAFSTSGGKSFMLAGSIIHLDDKTLKNAIVVHKASMKFRRYPAWTRLYSFGS